MSDEEPTTVPGSDESSGDGSSASEPELMIATRERRKTAGNRYSQVVAQEQADEDEEDDVALLFAEAEGEDEEYNSDEADDEADMSSSDDDDHGPNAAPEDTDGEKELQKQAKIERQKKRKADMTLTTMSGIRKKPKIDPTSLHRAPDKPKPSKRKERVSWLPDQDARPGRTSLRKQTVAHREVMLERLKESEEQRLKNKAQREQKEKERQAEAPKELTQADRLADAEKNERRNAKSLNRWEATEKRRAEEQAAKLAALKDRKLNGAFVTIYSTKHVYRGPKVDWTSPGLGDAEDFQAKKRGRRSKGPQDQSSTPVPISGNPLVQSPLTSITSNTTGQLPVIVSAAAHAPLSTPSGFSTHTVSDGWLAGIHEYASMQPDSGPAVTSKERTQTPASSEGSQVHAQPPQPGVQQAPVQLERSNASSNTVQGPVTASILPIAATTQPNQTQVLSTQPTVEGQKSALPAEHQQPPGTAMHVTNASIELPQQHRSGPLTPATSSSAPMMLPQHLQHPIQPVQPVIEVTSTRNFVLLERFEELAGEARQAYNIFYNTKKAAKPVKPLAEICPMTGFTAKYRDPTTGAAYANLTAYKKLKEFQKHGFLWSSMLGSYVGRSGYAARGVPDGFLDT